MAEVVLRFAVPPGSDARGRALYPPHGQNALDSMHWSKRARYVRAWQDQVLRAWRSLPEEERELVEGEQVRAHLVIPVTTNQWRDAHGWVPLFKLTWDGLRCPEPRKDKPSCRSQWPDLCSHGWPDDDERYLLGVPEITFVKGAD